VIAGSVQVQEALLVLKILFLVLLYLFIWRIVRAASKDVRSTQESFILGPQQAAGLRAATPAPQGPSPIVGGALVVVASPILGVGEQHGLNSAPPTRHARVAPRCDGVWVEDLGSTNGTYVNGMKLTRPRRLEPGDVVRVGETELRFEG
jgi:FHA domain-containing protein